MDEKLKGLTGLCVRAGQGIFGEEGCLKALRNGQAGLAMLDGEISPGAAEKMERAARQGGRPVYRVPAGFLAEATGRPGKVMAIRNGGFAEKIAGILGAGEEKQ